MEPNCILVKTAPELYIKSRFVNREMTRLLVKNIQVVFSNKGFSKPVFVQNKGRLQIRGKELQKMLPVLKTVFGVHSAALAEFVSSVELKTIVEKTVEWAVGSIHSGDSFAIDCSRAGNQLFSSKEVEIQSGARVLERVPKAIVDLSHPKKTVFVNIQSNGFFVFASEESGPNGLPVGSQGRIGFLAQGFKNEEKAIWLLLKRGCAVFPIVSGKKIPVFLKKLEKWNSFQLFETVSKKTFEQNPGKFGFLALANAQSALPGKTAELEKSKPGQFGFSVLCPLQGFPFEELRVKP